MFKVPRCKCILIGDSKVGKTSILERFLDPDSVFNKKYNMTTGINISFKQMQINKVNSSNQTILGNNLNNNLNSTLTSSKPINKVVSFEEDDDDENRIDNLLELYIYDISGQRIYLDLLKSICNNVSMVIGVFDLSRIETFKKLQTLLNDLMKQQFQITNNNNAKNNSINDQEIDKKSTVLGVIIGNKTDLEERRLVNEQDAQTLAKKYKFTYFECSAKMNSNIDDVFTFLSTKFLDQFLED